MMCAMRLSGSVVAGRRPPSSFKGIVLVAGDVYAIAGGICFSEGISLKVRGGALSLRTAAAIVTVFVGACGLLARFMADESVLRE